MSSIDLLKPYPFQRLRELFKGVVANPELRPINLSIGEPKHPTPQILKNAMSSALDGLAVYPATQGLPELRQCLSDWIYRRFDARVDVETQVLPVLGSREALFSFTQVVLDDAVAQDLVAFPNPFYQIYEGASFLGGATPLYLNIHPETGLPDWKAITSEQWNQVKLLFVCSPNNPTGSVISLEQWQMLFDLANEHDFVIASDECYSEIYLDEQSPPIGALEAAVRLGRSDFNNLVVFSSLSKRSNAPGLRSGYVAGDAEWIERFLKYRTYHGSAMSTVVQQASIAAWNDEAHVIENRALYRAKFETVKPILEQAFEVHIPQAGFYIWLNVSFDDKAFAKQLFHQQNVTVLPGSFLGRDIPQGNPGTGYLRIALVASLDECTEAAHRIVAQAKLTIS